MGISVGGMIGLWLGANAGDRVDRLVLCNTAAKLPADIWAERIAKVRAGGMAAIVDPVLQRWFTARYLARGDESLAGIRAALLAVDPAGYTGCCAAIRDMDLRECLGAIRARRFTACFCRLQSRRCQFGQGFLMLLERTLSAA